MAEEDALMRFDRQHIREMLLEASDDLSGELGAQDDDARKQALIEHLRATAAEIGVSGPSAVRIMRVA
jgi:hypothetical protein